jgi:nucleotide-binding universal stress UspA family protein
MQLSLSTRRKAQERVSLAAESARRPAFGKVKAMHGQEMTKNSGPANQGLSTVVAQPRNFLRNILWSTDFSAPSEISLPFAAALARRFGSRFYAAHVISPYIQYFGPGMPLLRLGLAEQMAVRKMSELLDSQSLGDAPGEKIVGLGRTSRVLANMVQDFDIDLLILGTRGGTGIVGRIFGAVAEETIRRSPCPVLSVGARTGKATGNDVDFKHVLCATDFSLESISAVRLALEWVKAHSARLTLLHAVDRCVANSVEERRRLTFFFEKRLQRLIPPRAMQIPGLALQIEFGGASESILETAERTAADLLVLGARRADALGGPPGRRTVARVLNKARCPLLTVNQSTAV